MKSKEIVKTNSDHYKLQMGINKPSALCQVMYFEDAKKGLFAYLNPIEIDLINLILYKSREEIIKNKIDLDGVNFKLELLLKDISATFNKYTSTGYDPLITNFRNLRNKEVVINALNKNKEMETTYTSIIHKIKVSKHQNSKLKKITLELDNEIIGMMLDVKKMFSTMFFKIQFSLDLKYSKLLYEILRDYLGKNYNGVKSRVIEIDMLLGLLNVKNLERYKKFSFFNGEIIKKAVNEINEKSDILVEYEPIKERPDGGRLQVTKIKFSMKRQDEKRLEELGIMESEEEDLSVEEQLQYDKKESIALERLEKAKQYQTIDNEEAWLKKTIESITDDFLTELDDIGEAKENLDNIDIKDFAEMLESKYKDFVGMKDYKLIYVFDENKPSITNNALETVEVLSSLE